MRVFRIPFQIFDLVGECQDKAIDLIDRSLDGETVDRDALYTATDIFKNIATLIYSRRAEKERYRQELWPEKITDAKKKVEEREDGSK